MDKNQSLFSEKLWNDATKDYPERSDFLGLHSDANRLGLNRVAQKPFKCKDTNSLTKNFGECTSLWKTLFTCKESKIKRSLMREY